MLLVANVYNNRGTQLLNGLTHMNLLYNYSVQSTEIPFLFSSLLTKIKQKIDYALAFESQILKEDLALSPKEIFDNHNT